MNNYDEYLRQGEPDKIEKSRIWKMAIGLQQVDGLRPSDYLIKTANENIEGKITIDEVKRRIDSYYKTQTVSHSDRTEEADKVAAKITEVLLEHTFSFSPLEYINIHKRLFEGIYPFAGKVRDYNISKQEWVLDGKSVMYAGAHLLREALEHDFKQEKEFDYKGLSAREKVEHIAKFISNIWQAHVFGEGNTRTTAVFAIKYLRTFGFAVNNEAFENHSYYFRNSLVRANYNDFKNNIVANQEYLNKFFYNILLGEQNELKSRYLHIYFNRPDAQYPSSSDADGGVNVGESVGESVGEVSERQKRILDIIAANNSISAQQLSAILKTTARTVEREIKKMREKGILERIGGDRGGHWKINGKEDRNE
ncbi:MAG: Fic family protein [Tannerellaceae bacterium]|jgi:fido (protein-threonine AMPylation protein)/biotin operon repressor|nr:Fic family protein [Tannerellaceae bacterium]